MSNPMETESINGFGARASVRLSTHSKTVQFGGAPLVTFSFSVNLQHLSCVVQRGERVIAKSRIKWMKGKGCNGAETLHILRQGCDFEFERDVD